MSCHSGGSVDGWPAAVTVNSAATFVSVIDDDDSVRESLPSLLREFGLTSNAFATPDDFLQSAFADNTTCLILDIAMAGMSGPELLRRGHDIPIIFITAHADCASRPEILVGAADCLIKPFSDLALLEALEKALNSQ